MSEPTNNPDMPPLEWRKAQREKLVTDWDTLITHYNAETYATSATSPNKRQPRDVELDRMIWVTTQKLVHGAAAGFWRLPPQVMKWLNLAIADQLAGHFSPAMREGRKGNLRSASAAFLESQVAETLELNRRGVIVIDRPVAFFRPAL